MFNSTQLGDNNSLMMAKIPFLAHFHPSVSLFASSLLNGDTLPNKPDLSLHTLIHFLDRFVYRNARSSTAAPRGVSIMQPLAGGDTSHLLVSARHTSRGQAPVNSEAFRRLKSDHVAADEAFFHDYFTRVGRTKPGELRRSAVSGVDKKKESEDEDIEEEIWKALVNSRPELDDDEQSDSSLGMEDLESDSEDISPNLETKQPGDLNLDGVSYDGEDTDLESELISDSEALLESEEYVPSKIDRTFENQSLASGLHNQKRRKLKQLPTFASAEDYAAVLNGDDDEG